MAEVEPLLLHEDLEPLQGPVVGVQQELGEGEELGGSVPAITAVHYHGPSFRLNKSVINTMLLTLLSKLL